MTAESRKAIPGRSSAEDRSLDRLVFGDNTRDKTEKPERPDKQDKPAEGRERDIRVRMRAAANDDDVEDRAPDPVLVEDISFVERAAKDRRRNTDRRRGYSRLPDERGNFGSENSKRGPMLAAIAIGVVLVFGALVWNMYRDGVKSENNSVKPKVIAGGSYKSKPEAEPGVDVDGAQVFDQIGGTTPGSLDGGPTEAVVEPGVAPAPQASTAASVAPAPKAEVKPSPAPAVAPKAVAASAPKPEPKVVAPRVAAPVVVAAAPTAAAVGFKPAFAANGPYVVQMAALSSEAEAETEWAKRTRSAPDLFASAEKIVVKAEVNGKTVYRLRAGAFATSADAEAFCGAFKARGGVCFRAARQNIRRKTVPAAHPSTRSG